MIFRSVFYRFMLDEVVYFAAEFLNLEEIYIGYDY